MQYGRQGNRSHGQYDNTCQSKQPNRMGSKHARFEKGFRFTNKGQFEKNLQTSRDTCLCITSNQIGQKNQRPTQKLSEAFPKKLYC